MIQVLYNGLVLPLLRAVLVVAQLGSRKLRQRRSTERFALRSARDVQGAPRIMFHAASMGELEQVLPIMHILKHQLPECCIIYSCSSPSGYSHAIKQSCIDAVVYLPVDTKRNTREFLDALQPDIFVIDRYDVWPNVVHAASKRCPVVLINATFPSVADSPLLTSWVERFYRSLTHISAVSEQDARRLSKLCNKDISWLPDTRIDRVVERITDHDSSVDSLRTSERPTLILGSSWTEDEDLVLSALKRINANNLRLIVVPHEPTEHAIARIEHAIECTRLSRIQGAYSGNIVVDSVGKLLSLYRLADAAFVGGGFGAGVHSTTEPIGYGIPVACGPHIGRSRDAQELKEAGLLRVVKTQEDVISWITSVVLDTQGLHRAKEKSHDYVRARTGSASRYADMLFSLVTSEQR
jgi:3-deoxy-D-manno-octulosonic-acid transferase